MPIHWAQVIGGGSWVSDALVVKKKGTYLTLIATSQQGMGFLYIAEDVVGKNHQSIIAETKKQFLKTVKNGLKKILNERKSLIGGLI